MHYYGLHIYHGVSNFGNLSALVMHLEFGNDLSRHSTSGTGSHGRQMARDTCCTSRTVART
jgi:hypothetical protein